MDIRIAAVAGATVFGGLIASQLNGGASGTFTYDSAQQINDRARFRLVQARSP